METFYLKKASFCDPEEALEIISRMGWATEDQMIDKESYYAVFVPDDDCHLMDFIFDYFM